MMGNREICTYDPSKVRVGREVDVKPNRKLEENTVIDVIQIDPYSKLSVCAKKVTQRGLESVYNHVEQQRI